MALKGPKRHDYSKNALLPLSPGKLAGGRESAMGAINEPPITLINGIINCIHLQHVLVALGGIDVSISSVLAGVAPSAVV